MSSGDAVLFPVSFMETSSERVVRKFRRVVYMLEYATDFAVFFKESEENG